MLELQANFTGSEWTVTEHGQPFGTIRFASMRTRADIAMADGRTYEFAREPRSGPMVLRDHVGGQVASATRRSEWCREAFDVQTGADFAVLAAASMWSARELELNTADDRTLARMRREGFSGNKGTAELPEDWDAALRMFVATLGILIWRRSDSAAAAGAQQ